MAKIRLPDATVEPDAASWWNFSIAFNDGTTKQVNMQLTDGLLLNNNTPTWYAQRENNSYEVAYKKVSVSKFDA